MPQERLFKLKIWLKCDSELLLIESILDEDDVYLKQTATDRKKNNSNYVCMIMSYSLSKAKMIK